MPASRTFLALAALTVSLVSAVVVPWFVWLVLVLDVLVLIAVLLDYGRAGKIRLSASRSLPPLLVQGKHTAVDVEIRSFSSHEITVLLRESLNPQLASRPLRKEISIPPQGRALWRYEMLPRRRGEHALGGLYVRVLGPWKLAWAQRQLLEEEPHRVYPQIRWEGRVGQLLALARRRELGRSLKRLRGTGSEPYALREYLPGDPPNKIHWKATARHGHLVTREDTWEQGARLILLLDCARAMASIGAGSGDGALPHSVNEASPAHSKLDYALAAALALTRVAAARGDNVTVIAFSNRPERAIRLRAGGVDIGHAYESLYDLEARFVEPAYDLAAENALSMGTRRATVVLLTSVVDLAAAEGLREALVRLRRRHLPLLVNLEDPELSRLALGQPGTPNEAFAKVSSMEILLTNRRLAKRLQREGIRVVNTAADRLTLDVLEAYLAIYRSRIA